jgi:hypothetical protein
MSDLTFAEVTEANVARCQRWHAGGLDGWSVTDWSNATAGELGEVCNAIKKLRRVEDGIANISDPGRLLASRDEAVAVIGEEIADTFLYLNLLACRLGISLADKPHCCVGYSDECGCFGETVREMSDRQRANMPPLEYVRLERRPVGEWTPHPAPAAGGKSESEESK